MTQQTTRPLTALLITWPASLPALLKVHQLILGEIPLDHWIGAFFGELFFALAYLGLLSLLDPRRKMIAGLAAGPLMLGLIVLHAVYMKLGLFYQPGQLHGSAETLLAAIRPFLERAFLWEVFLILPASFLLHALIHRGLGGLIGTNPDRQMGITAVALVYLVLSGLWFQPRYEEQTAAVVTAVSGLFRGDAATGAEPPTHYRDAYFQAAGVTPFEGLPQDKRYNLVVYSMESTRALATNLYGGGLDTTPFLSSMRDKGLFFERCYSNSVRSIKALTTMLLGIYPHYSISAWSPRPIHRALEDSHLTAILNEENYHTAFFVNSHISFDTRDKFLKNLALDVAKGTDVFISRDDSVLVDELDAQFRDADDGGQALFSMLLSSSGHAPYPFPGKPISDEAGKEEALRLGIGKMAGHYTKYLNTVHHQDDVAGQIYGYLEETGRLEDTIFVVVGDHGESFGEHGALGGFGLHGAALFEESVHVPLWIHHPDLEPRVVSEPVQFLDFVPTWLAMMGIETPHRFLGRNMLLDPREFLFMTNHVKGRVVAVLRDHFKLIRYREADDPQAFFQLFDLKSDPWEKHDLGKSHPAFQPLSHALEASDWFFPNIQKHYEDIYFNRKARPEPFHEMSPWLIEVAENEKALPAGRRLLPHLPKVDSSFRIRLHFTGLGREGGPLTVRYLNDRGGLVDRAIFAVSDQPFWLPGRKGATQAELITPVDAGVSAELVSDRADPIATPLVDRVGDRLIVGGGVDQAVTCALVISGADAKPQQVAVTLEADDFRETRMVSLSGRGRKLLTFDVSGREQARFQLEGRNLAAFVLRWSGPERYR